MYVRYKKIRLFLFSDLANFSLNNGEVNFSNFVFYKESAKIDLIVITAPIIVRIFIYFFFFRKLQHYLLMKIPTSFISIYDITINYVKNVERL